MNQPKSIEVAEEIQDSLAIGWGHTEHIAKIIERNYGTETRLRDEIRQLKEQVQTMRANHRLQLTCGSK